MDNANAAQSKATLIVYNEYHGIESYYAWITIDDRDVGVLNRGASIKITNVPIGGHHSLDAFRVRSSFPWKHPHTGHTHPLIISVVAPKEYFYTFTVVEPRAGAVEPGAVILFLESNRENLTSLQVRQGSRENQEKLAPLISGEYDYEVLIKTDPAEIVHVMHHPDPTKAILVLLHNAEESKSVLAMLAIDVNGKRVPRLLNPHEGVMVEVEPGEVTIDSHDADALGKPVEKSKKTRKLAVEGGHTYYLDAKMFGLFRIHFKMVDCSPEKAEKCNIQRVEL